MTFKLNEQSLKDAMKPFEVIRTISIADVMGLESGLRHKLGNEAREEFMQQFEMEGMEGESTTPLKGDYGKKRTQSWLPFSKKYGEWKKTLPRPKNRALILTERLQRAIRKKIVRIKGDIIEFAWRAKSPKGFPYSDVHQDFPGAEKLRPGMRRRSLVITQDFTWRVRDMILRALADNWEKLR